MARLGMSQLPRCRNLPDVGRGDRKDQLGLVDTNVSFVLSNPPSVAHASRFSRPPEPGPELARQRTAEILG